LSQARLPVPPRGHAAGIIPGKRRPASCRRAEAPEFREYFGLRSVEYADLDRRDPASDHPEPLGGAARNVDNPPLDEGAAVVDADLDRTLRLQIRHPHARAEGQRPV